MEIIYLIVDFTNHLTYSFQTFQNQTYWDKILHHIHVWKGVYLGLLIDVWINTTKR